MSGCSKHPASDASSNKVRVGYIGLTCEAPLYVACEKGFFKEEGLEVELVKCSWANCKERAVALGRFSGVARLAGFFSDIGACCQSGQTLAVVSSDLAPWIIAQSPTAIAILFPGQDTSATRFAPVVV